MNKLHIKKGNANYLLHIENRKFLIGNNYITKYNLFRAVTEYFNGNESEYSLENKTKSNIFINDQLLIKKNLFFYHVTPNFSIDNDLRLTSKSLSNRYFELLYNDPQYHETIHTINILLESLTEEINLDSIMYTNFSPIITKQLIKLTNPYIAEDQLQQNEFDMSYQQNILYQLQIIKHILDTDKTISHAIILIDLPYLNTEILEAIHHIDYAYIIIQTTNYYPSIPIHEIVLCEDVMLDLEDEKSLYHKITTYEYNFKYTTQEDIKKMLERYVHKQTEEPIRLMDQLLL